MVAVGAAPLRIAAATATVTSAAGAPTMAATAVLRKGREALPMRRLHLRVLLERLLAMLHFHAGMPLDLLHVGGHLGVGWRATVELPPHRRHPVLLREDGLVRSEPRMALLDHRLMLRDHGLIGEAASIRLPLMGELSLRPIETHRLLAF
jgi:hypothetical protein